MTKLSDLVAAHLAQYAREHTKRGTKPRAKTLESHRLHLEKFARAFDAEYPDGVIPAEAGTFPISVNFCKNYFIERIQSTSISNRNQTLAAIAEFLRWMVNDNRLPADRLEAWQEFHSKEYRRWHRTTPNHKFLRSEQLHSLMNALSRNSSGSVESDRNLSFFGLIFFGPSRLGEIHLIDCKHIKHILPAKMGTNPSPSFPHDMGETQKGVIPAQAGTNRIDDSADIPTDPPFFAIHIPAASAKNGQRRNFRLHYGSILGGHDIYQALLRYYTWRTGESKSGPFFVSMRPEWKMQRPNCSNWHSVLKSAARRAGVKATSHYLRHTFGELAAAALSERDLCQIYQHSDPRTTEIYTHHDNDERLDRARRLLLQKIADY